MKTPDLEAEPVIETVGRVVAGVAVQHQQFAIQLAAEVFKSHLYPVEFQLPGPRVGAAGGSA